MVHNLLMQFFTLDSSKIEVSEAYFSDIVTTYHDKPGYIRHVLGIICVFFILFGDWVCGGGGQPMEWYTTCLCHFLPRTCGATGTLVPGTFPPKTGLPGTPPPQSRYSRPKTT